MVSRPAEAPEVFFVDHERLQHRANREVGQLVAPRVPTMRGSFGRLLGTIPDEGARQTELAEGMWITKQSLGERLRALEERGWISIEPDPADRRARIVRRTPEGTRIRELTEQAMDEMEARWASEVGAERYRVFREVLAELSRRA